MNNFAGEMGNGPEKEKDSESTQDGAHEIHGPGGCQRIIAKENDKKAAHHHKQRCAGGVGDL